MELIKKILFCSLFLFIVSCDGQNKNKNNEQAVHKTRIAQKEKETFVLQKQFLKNEDILKYYFEESIYQLILTHKSHFNLSINKQIYRTELLLDSASINIWDLKKSGEHIILIEGDDYYGSVFHAYYYDMRNLIYYGTFNYKEKDIEKNHSEKKINASFIKDKLIISLFQDNKNYKYNLKSIKKVYKIGENHIDTIFQLKEKWKHKNLEIIKEKTADIDQDGKEDKIYVLWSSAKNNFPIYIILQRENNYINNIMNENILSPVPENSTGIGLTDIVCKRGYITFEENISEGNPTKNKYITFLYNKNDDQIFLHKYGINIIYDDDNSTKNSEKIYTPQNFGKIKFESFNAYEIARKLE